MGIKQLVSIAGVLVAGALSLPASTVYQYSFGGLGVLGSSSHAFSPVSGPSSLSITAYGVDALGGSNLYSKGSNFNFSNLSYDSESGLGLASDPTGDHEISPRNYVVLDLANLAGFLSKGLYVESSSGTDRWAIWGWNGSLSDAASAFSASSVISGSSQGLQDLSALSGDQWIALTATSGNVLLGAFRASAAPEPASEGLLGLALIGTALVIRSRRTQSA